MEDALKLWEPEHTVDLVDPKRDALYSYDAAEQKALLASKPWALDPRYFKRVQIGAMALMKMVMHAQEGGRMEVMGVMQGYIKGDTFVITDAFRLPVENTETRVNAQAEANEYLINYLDLCREQGARPENVVGWYHSHPGYGCWLSGIDVGTQSQQQQFVDPFLAIVIDPDRTSDSGKVDIGAFRTLPEDHSHSITAAANAAVGDASVRPRAVPADKLADFGAHANRYYSLEVLYFRSTLDARLLELLWHKYWVQTLSQNPLLTGREFSNQRLRDLGSKVRDAAAMASGGSGGSAGLEGLTSIVTGLGRSFNAEHALAKVADESNQLAVRERMGLVANQVKTIIFGAPKLARTTAGAGEALLPKQGDPIPNAASMEP